MASGGSRTLKLSILGDVDQLKKSLTAANSDVEQSSSRISDFGKKAGLAFAAAGAAAAIYAGKFLIEATKNAAEDAKAQRNLALTLENTTGATKNQIAAVEDYISKTAIAFGVTDDQLRPAFERLTRSTKDVSESQDLMNLAIGISAATSKPLETITAALAKAYDGNASSLGRLGLGIDQSILKSKDFDQITSALRENFAGFAEQEANTFEGKLRRLQIAFDEGKETIGSFVLDAITPLVTILVETLIPKIGEFSAAIGENLAPVFADFTTFFTETLIPIFQVWWELLSTIIIPGIIKTVTPILKGLFEAFQTIAKSITDNKDKLQPLFDLFVTVAKFVYTTLAPAVGTVLGGAFKVLGGTVSAVISLIANLVSVITRAIDLVKQLVSAAASLPDIIGGLFGGGKASGGAVKAGTTYLVGERGAELFTPSSSGTITPNNRLGGVGNNTVINLSVYGAVDSEGTARTIIQTLNDSFYRGTLGAGALVSA